MKYLNDTNPTIENLRDLLRAPLEVKLEWLEHYQEIIRLLSEEMMAEEARHYTGERHSRARPYDGRYYRWGSNPGSVRIQGERARVRVPRVRDHYLEEELPLESYQALHAGSDDRRLTDALLLGLSSRDYRRVASQFADGFGLSQSVVSRQFVEESAAALERFVTRSLANDDIVVLWLDGKHLACEQIVLCLGLRMDGTKRVLGFVETTTENAEAVKGLFRDLIERGLRFDQGLFVVVDGSKGLAKAVEQTFGTYGILQRCQWHKRENVVSYLKKTDRDRWRRRLQQAYQKPTYKEAKAALMQVHTELEKLNRSAANSLLEGLEQTLTIHRLGLFDQLGKSLKTTNCIEGLNSRIEAYLGKVKRWMSSDQRQRWVALAVLEIETRLFKIQYAHYLPLLRQALQREIARETESFTTPNSN
jgi:transposase-like protein